MPPAVGSCASPYLRLTRSLVASPRAPQAHPMPATKISRQASYRPCPQHRGRTQVADADNALSELAYADTLWRLADALRGQVDAAEYKHVVLGLLFLKYISDSFDARRSELTAELESEGISGPQAESLLESRDEYTAERVFWVPPEARWSSIQAQATRPDIAALID